MKKSPAIPFAKGSPDSLTGNEDCLAMHVDSEGAYLDDKPCDSQSFYICEVAKGKIIIIHGISMIIISLWLQMNTRVETQLAFALDTFVIKIV